MENFVKTFYKQHWIIFLTTGLMLFSCTSSSEEGVPKYDPTKDVVLDTFYPKSGSIATQVILEGENFGDTAEDVQVWFNEKKAAVISAKGEKILVLAPKLPGDHCIISVKIAGDSTSCEDEIFRYITQTTVSTLAGGDKNATAMPEGTSTLSTAQFNGEMTHSMAIDGDDNLFFTANRTEGDQNSTYYYFYLANEEDDRIKLLNKEYIIVGSYMVGYHRGTGDVYWRMTNGDGNSYNYYDHTADFASISAGNINWDVALTNSSGWGVWSTFNTLTTRPSDDKFYLRGNHGELVRFNPVTGEGENLSQDDRVPFEGGQTYGLVFDRKDDNIFYFSVADRHAIYKYDLRTNVCELFAGQLNSGGHLDGEALVAKFNNPRQMCIDSENNIYVADMDNHCIRRISTETNYVSTFAGNPIEAPNYVNGTALAARFNKPVGLVITSDDVMYIGDSENKAIRRLAVE